MNKSTLVGLSVLLILAGIGIIFVSSGTMAVVGAVALIALGVGLLIKAMVPKKDDGALSASTGGQAQAPSQPVDPAAPTAATATGAAVGVGAAQIEDTKADSTPAEPVVDQTADDSPPKPAEEPETSPVPEEDTPPETPEEPSMEDSRATNRWNRQPKKTQSKAHKTKKKRPTQLPREATQSKRSARPFDL